MYPEAAPRIRQSIVDDYADYLDQRLGKAAAAPQGSGANCASKASVDRSTVSGTGFGSVALASRKPLALSRELRLCGSRHGRWSGSC